MGSPDHMILSYSKEEMLPYAFAYLKKDYPSWEGWKLQYNNNEETESVSPDFILERYHEGFIHKIVVVVKLAERIIPSDVANIKLFAKILRRQKCLVEKIMIVPAFCDTSKVPEDIKIIYLKEFK
jgi:hypothetical protein